MNALLFLLESAGLGLRKPLRSTLITLADAKSSPGLHRLMVRAVNRFGESQGLEPLWNPAGYLRNVVEEVEVQAS